MCVDTGTDSPASSLTWRACCLESRPEQRAEILFVWGGGTSAVLKAYSWLCVQRSLLVRLRRPYMGAGGQTPISHVQGRQVPYLLFSLHPNSGVVCVCVCIFFILGTQHHLKWLPSPSWPCSVLICFVSRTLECLIK